VKRNTHEPTILPNSFQTNHRGVATITLQKHTPVIGDGGKSVKYSKKALQEECDKLAQFLLGQYKKSKIK